ncbi:WD40 repeat domain-containing serine/threonine protein kinase [Sinosporangium siamense]|uniref:WD40 repeat domain-containing serine/threonine protein kinase n=1 Tax=Sinosporangium siamense TaxID=1367973 RepID=UPI001950E21B|nr:serine/threonine-protein kinase [Sinosporangium siamense]
MRDEDGDLLAGRYRLVEQIGAGGMGRVWRGHDETLERDVAIKEILFPPGIEPAQRDVLTQRAMREARSAARLNHPGIVTVHDVIDSGTAPVIVMEYVRGRSLAQVIAEEGRLDPLRVAAIGAMMLEALQEAHAAEIIHRDLKPANVLLAGKRTVITDFGIASLAGDATLTASGMLIGTPSYMAPEQARGKRITPACDLWSLGATLYAAVEGRAPYSGTDVIAVLSALLSDEPEPPHHAGPLAPLLAGLLRKDPAERFTAEEAARSLAGATGEISLPPASAVRHEPTLADPDRTVAVVRDEPPGTVVDPAPPAVRRRLPGRRAIVVGGLGTLALIAAGVTLLPRGMDPEPGRWVRGKPLLAPGFEGRPVAFSPDGGTLALPDGAHRVQLWDVAKGAVTTTLTGHTDRVLALAFAPDRSTLATVSEDSSVRLWEVGTNKSTTPLTELNGVERTAVFSADCKTLATAGSGGVMIWDVTEGKNTFTLWDGSTFVYDMSFSSDGHALATTWSLEAAPAVRLWDVTSGTETLDLTGDNSPAVTVAFSPDGTSLATGSTDGSVRLWEVSTGKNTATLGSHGRSVNDVAFSPDGTTLASAGADGTVRLWDIATGRSAAVLRGPARTVVFARDGRTLAAGMGGEVRLWRAT